MQQARRAAERNVKRLKEKLSHIIDAEGIELEENDEHEMEELFSIADKEIEDHEGRSMLLNSFPRCFSVTIKTTEFICP